MEICLKENTNMKRDFVKGWGSVGECARWTQGRCCGWADLGSAGSEEGLG